MGRLWRRVTAYLIPWTVVGIFFSGQIYLNYLYAHQALGWGEALYLGLSEWYIWAGLSPALFYLARRFPLSRGHWGRSLSIHIPATFGITLAKLLRPGMGSSLTLADQKEAYILTDRGTFLALSRPLDLEVVSEGDPELINIYSVMQVDPGKGQINADEAAAWVAFLLERETQDRIEAFRRAEFGRSLFTPTRGRSEAETIDDFVAGASQAAGLSE